jgi:hypothetical protein
MPSILCPQCGEQNDTEQTGVRCRCCNLPLPVLSLDAPEEVVGIPVPDDSPSGDMEFEPDLQSCAEENATQPPVKSLSTDLSQYPALDAVSMHIGLVGLRISEEEVQAFVGPGAGYYLACWQPPLTQGGLPTGFNLAACLFTGLWLPYRKLYAATAMFFAILIGLALVERYFFLHVLGLADLPSWAAVATAVVVGVFYGKRANHLYWNKTRDVIWQVRRRALPAEEHYSELARRGGTSTTALVGGSLTGVVAVAVANVLFDQLPIFNEIRRMEQTVRAGMEKEKKIQVATCRLARRPDGNIAGTLTEVGGEQWDILRVWAEGRQVRWYFLEPVSRIETRLRAEIQERIGDAVKSAQVRKTPEGTISGTIETQGGVICDVLQTPPDAPPPLVYWQVNERSFPNYMKVATRKDDFSLVDVRLEAKAKGEWSGEGTDSRGGRYDIVLRVRGAVADAQLGQAIEWDLIPRAAPQQPGLPGQWPPRNRFGQPPGWPFVRPQGPFR